MLIEFMADTIDIGKKRIDGSRSVILEVGEYEHDKLKPIVSMPEGNLKVTIELE